MLNPKLYEPLLIRKNISKFFKELFCLHYWIATEEWSMKPFGPWSILGLYLKAKCRRCKKEKRINATIINEFPDHLYNNDVEYR